MEHLFRHYEREIRGVRAVLNVLRQGLSLREPIASSGFRPAGQWAPTLRATRRWSFLVIVSLFFLLGLFAGENKCYAETQNQNSSGSLDFANGLYARKMYGPAISEYQKFIQASPESADAASAYYRLAESYYFLKEYAKAINSFESFRSKFPTDERSLAALLRIGTAQYFLKNYPAAHRVFSDIAAVKADDNIQAGALFYSAKTSEAEGKLDEAISTLRRLTDDYPETDYTMYACLFAGDIFAARKNEDEAIRVYRLVADGVVSPPKAQAAESAVEEATLKAADLYFFQKKYSNARAYYQKAYDRPKRASLDRILTGLFFANFYLKDLEASKKLLLANEAYLNKSPGHVDIDYLLGVLAHEKKDFVFSLERLDQILKDPKAPGDMKAKALAARAYIQAESLRDEGKLEEALPSYLEAAKSGDSLYSLPALYQAGFLSAQLKKNEDARQLLASYMEKNPKSDEAARAALEKIQLDLDEEKWDAVVLASNQFLETYPKSRYEDVALYKLGMALGGQKNDDRAALIFEKLILNQKNSVLYPEALYGAAASFDNAQDTRKAIKYYEEFTQKYPSHPLYPGALARLGFLYVRDKNYETAARFYEDILLNKPEIPLESSAAFWVIRHDLNHSQYDRMRAVLTLLSRRYPDEVLTHEINFFLGESLMGLKNYTDALQYYSKSVEAKPDGPYVPYAYLGMGIAAAAQDHLDTAENFFVKVLGFESGLDAALRARFELANLYLKRGNLQEASKAFMHVAILYDDEKYSSAALYKAGECFVKLGNKDEAQKVFEELVKRYPKSPWARRATHFFNQENLKAPHGH